MRLSRLLLLVTLLPGLGAQDLPAGAPASANTALSAAAPAVALARAAVPLPTLSVAIINLMSRSDCQPRFPAPGVVNPANVPQPGASGIICLTFGIPQPADWLVLGIDDATVPSAVLDSGEDLSAKPLPELGRRYGRGRRAEWLYHDAFMGAISIHAGELRFGTCVIAGPLAPAAKFKTLALQTTVLLVATAELHHEALALGSGVSITDVPGVQLVITPTLSTGVRIATSLHSLPLIVAVDFFSATHQPLHPISSTRNDRALIDLRFSEAPATVAVTCMTQAHQATITMSFDGLALVGQNAAAVIGPKPVTGITLGASLDLDAEVTKALGPETTTVPIPQAAPATPQALHNSNF